MRSTCATRLVVEHQTLVVSWPASFTKSLRVVFASDFHSNARTPPSFYSGVCRRIEMAKPDVLLLGGDYISSDTRGLGTLSRQLADLGGTCHRFAILGDHDTRADPVRIQSALTEAGFTFLVNECVALPSPFDGFQVAGLDDIRYGTPNVDALFQGMDGPRIIMAHSPAAVERVRDRPFRVMFCGHTHGGQIALPWGTPIYIPQGRKCRRFASGRFEIGSARNPKTVLVSRGVGCSVLPLRLFAPPDILVCDFRPTPSPGRKSEDFL